jgi:hypothetical protein
VKQNLVRKVVEFREQILWGGIARAVGEANRTSETNVKQNAGFIKDGSQNRVSGHK